MAAAVAINAALARDENSDGLARALRALEQHGDSARDLAEDANRSFGERVIEPLQHRAVGIGRRISGADAAERLRHRLDLAGNPRDWTVDRIIALKVIAAAALPGILLVYAVLIGLPLTWILIVVIAGVLIGFFGPDLYVYNLAQHRADKIKRTLADAVDLLTISVEAGLGFDAALQQVARNTDGPLAEEFSRVLREMQLGMGRSEALRALGERSNVDDLKTFAGAMVQADAFGIAIGQVLRVQSAEIRLKRRQYAEEKAQKVPVKIMMPLILFILPCLFIVVMAPAVLNAMDAFSQTG
ncbi:tight adherence protein C [Nocardioides aromaticivorans]|uniref:Tight adherence protein C n=1 Tax=Nocardioides aromaticivorans TaxID=200618 RepID=A0A7Y9ZMX5_9ACTN|nr:type II secretion system F family protein [Nocardioides aromaticivorans]NYI46885.1 tight adherence protein C [Nocardioides aromaticivorans]